MLHRPTLLFLSVFLLAGCSETPTGRSQLTLVPENMMNQMGEQAFADMKRSQTLDEEADRKALVQCVASRIIQATNERYPALATEIGRAHV